MKTRQALPVLFSQTAVYQYYLSIWSDERSFATTNSLRRGARTSVWYFSHHGWSQRDHVVRPWTMKWRPAAARIFQRYSVNRCSVFFQNQSPTMKPPQTAAAEYRLSRPITAHSRHNSLFNINTAMTYSASAQGTDRNTAGVAANTWYRRSKSEVNIMAYVKLKTHFSRRTKTKIEQTGFWMKVPCYFRISAWRVPWVGKWSLRCL